jgi:hypothetical protein
MHVTKNWNTRRAQGYAAVVGALYTGFLSMATEGVAPGGDALVAWLASAAGGALGAAAIVGIVCGLRNKFVRPDA